jgi:hypothetical protein
MYLIIVENNDPVSEGRSWITHLLAFVLYLLAGHIIFQTMHAHYQFPKSIRNKRLINP